MKMEVINGSGSEQSYVVKGATLKCSQGDKESKLNIPKDHGVYLKNKPQANIMDFKPNLNIKPFGKCRSMANPTVAAATAANKGRLKKMPCVPVITMPWINGKNDVNIDNAPALLNKSTNMCMWCGKISIKDDGQLDNQGNISNLQESKHGNRANSQDKQKSKANSNSEQQSNEAQTKKQLQKKGNAYKETVDSQKLLSEKPECYMTAAPPDKLFEANPYALPKDKGDIVIDGQKYPIYVPDYNGGPNANYHENGWSTVKTKYVSSSDTDWLAVIANLENESLDDSSNMSNKNIQDFCILSLILGFLQGYVNNTVTTYIHIEVQKKGSESHAIVQYGATNTILQSKAGFSYYYSDLKSVTDRNGVVWGKREAQNFVKEYFQCTDNKTYDIKVTLDSRHKTDKYIGYLSVNNEQVFLTPKLYSRDNAELGYFSISLDVINLNWKDYMNIRYLMEKPCLIPEVNIATINKMLVSNNIKFLS